MRRRFATTFLILLPFALPACGNTIITPDIEVDLHPKMRYEITLSIEGVPKSFGAAKGSAGYEVANDACVPRTLFSVATLAPLKNVPRSLSRINDMAYKGDLYVDLLMENDYSGQGLCRWSIRFVDFDL